MALCRKCGADGPFLSLSTWSLCPLCREEALSDILAAIRTVDGRFAALKSPPDGKSWATLTGSIIGLLDRLAAILPENLVPESEQADDPGPFALEEIRILLGSSDLDEPRLRSAASMLDRLLPFVENRSPENFAAFLRLRSKVFSALAKTDRDRAMSLLEKKHTPPGDQSQLTLI
ncbi:hypothetical protein C8D99_11049 [Aminivibrio pyruvatiphilus]|jgi:hypothetical protein|uniref:Uncharacterized protein n=1 Tax=Aminivibrio pyruvatiphilus TaxID=1005740 RepID=A0A4R8M6N6_9BACT|nr:hypothetical protein [Aminivibrio pyruvatiphilus]TDY59922.1 hypothetical protein C8D99_11049 [Aminivibrio pyruvatiphilus]